MNFSELVAAFQSRGFDYLTTPECEALVNDGYRLDICEAADWEFLSTTVSGTSPLEISDLRSIEYVINTTQERKMKARDRRFITDFNPKLSNPGNSVYYYVTGGNTVNLYPVSEDTMEVRYYKIAPKLTSSDTPLLPERFHTLIVDAAVARGYESSDDYELAQSARSAFLSRLQVAEEALLDPFRDGPNDFISISNYAAY